LSQEIKFGKVSIDELEEKSYSLDTTASAAVLFKERKSYYTYNSQMGWVLVTTEFERIKIYKKKGFDYATKKVPLYNRGDKDEMFSVKAFTYSLEGGKIEKTKLEMNQIFKEDLSENWQNNSFTMPNIKEGSVIEWEYTIESPFYSNINTLICQYDIPIKELKAEISIPEYFVFRVMPSSYYPINYKTGTTQKNYQISMKTSGSYGIYSPATSKTEYQTFSVRENTYSVVEKNIPALLEEPFVSSMNNYRAMINFEIAAFRPPNDVATYYNNTWSDVAKDIYNSPKFGAELSKNSHFKEDLLKLKNSAGIPDENMVAIFEFVKKKLKWNDEYGIYTSTDGIKKAYMDGIGNVAEVNLTLVAMLKEAGFQAHPVLISTRSHGIPLYPTHDGFNYVIACVESAGKIILFDATESHSTPDNLPLRDLNWEGRIVKEDGTTASVPLYPVVYSEQNTKLTSQMQGDGMITGTMITSFNNLKGIEYRKDFGLMKESDLKSTLESKYNQIQIEKVKLNNMENIYKPVIEMVAFSADNLVDIINDKIYLSPMLFLSLRENPFKFDDRSYPIDFGIPWKNQVLVSIKIPEGYSVESKPEDMALGLVSDLGGVIVQTVIENNTINIKYQATINSAVISSKHYKELKELYKLAIAKQQEKIVLSRSQI
jgi:hypothetical protein